MKQIYFMIACVFQYYTTYSKATFIAPSSRHHQQTQIMKQRCFVTVTDHHQQSHGHYQLSTTILDGSSTDSDVTVSEEQVKKRKRDKVMSFLRKKKILGANKDFSTAMGVDEGPVGKNRSVVKTLQKAKSAYKWCTDEGGIIDDMSEQFPFTSAGSQWRGFTDQVMGGISNGKLTRATLEGRTCNVMKGNVSLYNHGGFIQMATELTTDSSVSMTVDASDFQGVELEVYYRGDEEVENFDVRLRNKDCQRNQSSYRATFEVNPNKWSTIRVPFSDFAGFADVEGTTMDTSHLRRLGIVAAGKKMKVFLGLSSIKLYK